MRKTSAMVKIYALILLYKVLSLIILKIDQRYTSDKIDFLDIGIVI